MLNNDWAFDDPAGNFPVPLADLTAQSLQTFSSHLASIQGVLGLAATDINAIFADPGVDADMVLVNGVNLPAFHPQKSLHLLPIQHDGQVSEPLRD